jgi:sensor histidine kinase YesM
MLKEIKKKNIIWLHIVFWMFYSVLPFLTFVFNEKGLAHPAFIYSLITTFLNVINFYICYLLTTPTIFEKKKILRNLVIFTLFVTVFTAIRIVSVWGIYTAFDLLPANQIHINFGSIVTEFLETFGFSWVPITIKFTIDWYREQRQKTELINQKQESEIALLRSQINPHFLFNTLNNIYSLTLKKSENAPEAVMQLSGIMRYMLKESNHEKVPLTDEIEYLISYIKLQQLRFSEPNFIEFNTEGNPDGLMIAPMLFISFIENAFKHGNKKVVPPGINIYIKIADRKVELFVMNYLGNDESDNKDSNNGIGLENVRRRLELLYPGGHTLEINERDGKYIVQLTIEKL